MDISNNDVMSTPVATGTRRKSRRAVKIPDKFVPEVASSQNGSASAKRKRGQEYDENSASDLNEDEETSDATVESEVEDVLPSWSRRKGKAPRKPAAKKSKVNGGTVHEEGDDEVEATAVKLPNRPKKASRRPAIEDDNGEGLYGKRY